MEGLQGLGNWVVSWAESPYGLFALSLLTFAEASFLPVPPDILLIALCLIDPGNSFLYASICSAASALGAAFGYGLGRVGGRPLLELIVSDAKIRFVQKYYQKYDVLPVVIAGFIPLPYKVFTITAGVFLLNLKRFIMASALGRSSRFFLEGGLLYFFKEPVAILIQKYFTLFAALFVLVCVTGVVVIRVWFKRNMACTPESCNLRRSEQ